MMWLQNLGQPEEYYYRWFEELDDPWMKPLICLSFQVSEDSNSIWFYRENDGSIKLSTDVNESETSPLNCKHNVGILTRGGEDSEIYVRHFAQLRESTKRGKQDNADLAIKLRINEDTAMASDTA
ncbi:hypothetical protein RCL_jg8733.t1 [Rhizophagus clarus]|uniref:Uncharacterized protein n=1 Tax=Rhizophagus clarus TaxID=94130 RepID=A0A8H3LYY2_9GLOM|nr:hypothetical protein RCL_jg8733.t1 [Rhizophagus clarus]